MRFVVRWWSINWVFLGGLGERDWIRFISVSLYWPITISSLFLLRRAGSCWCFLLSRHAGIFLCLIYSVKYMGIIIETYRLSEYFKRLYWNLGILISRNLVSYKSFPPWWKRSYSPVGATVPECMNGFRGCNGLCASSARELADSLVVKAGLKYSGI